MDEQNYGNNNYGKRPFWQWMVIYLVIAVVAYSVIYYLWTRYGGGYQSQMPGGAQAPATALKSSQVSGSVSVSIKNLNFDPSGIIVKKGATVEWVNNDTMSHTVTGDKGGPASQYLNPGAKYNYTFNTVGKFPYHCSIHQFMKGVVTVTE